MMREHRPLTVQLQRICLVAMVFTLATKGTAGPISDRSALPKSILNASTTELDLAGSMPSATIHYAGTPFCNASGIVEASLSGRRGGVYAAWPAGLSIDSISGTIDLAKSSPGAYTVSYSVASDAIPSVVITNTEIEIGQAILWYADADGDGIGTVSDSLLSCAQPAGYVMASGDDCPSDPNKLSPESCGCGVADLHSLKIDAHEKDRMNTDLLSIFPNPSPSGRVHLRLNGLGPEKEQALIEIHDVRGGRLLSEVVSTEGSMMLERQMDLTHLGRGHYVMVVEVGDRYWARSVVLP